MAVIANFLSLGTFLLALAAGLIALAAYSAATGLPVLNAQVTMPNGRPNEIVVITDLMVQVDMNTLRVVIRNTSKFAARTPAVIAEFHGCGIPELDYGNLEGWTPIVDEVWSSADLHDPRGGRIIYAFQWDGGPNYAIHGESRRHLPGLNLNGLMPGAGPTGATLRLLADGYKYKTAAIDIKFAVNRPTGITSREVPAWL